VCHCDTLTRGGEPLVDLLLTSYYPLMFWYPWPIYYSIPWYESPVLEAHSVVTIQCLCPWWWLTGGVWAVWRECCCVLGGMTDVMRGGENGSKYYYVLTNCDTVVCDDIISIIIIIETEPRYNDYWLVLEKLNDMMIIDMCVCYWWLLWEAQRGFWEIPIKCQYIWWETCVLWLVNYSDNYTSMYVIIMCRTMILLWWYD